MYKTCRVQNLPKSSFIIAVQRQGPKHSDFFFVELFGKEAGNQT